MRAFLAAEMDFIDGKIPVGQVELYSLVASQSALRITLAPSPLSP
jgi:hypothetical protein